MQSANDGKITHIISLARLHFSTKSNSINLIAMIHLYCDTIFTYSSVKAV